MNFAYGATRKYVPTARINAIETEKNIKGSQPSASNDVKYAFLQIILIIHVYDCI